MTVVVQLFARARDLAGRDRLTLTLADGATTRHLRDAVANECPALADFVTRCAVAVAEDFAPDDAVIPAGAAIALIPPVSGGA